MGGWPTSLLASRLLNSLPPSRERSRGPTAGLRSSCVVYYLKTLCFPPPTPLSACCLLRISRVFFRASLLFCRHESSSQAGILVQPDALEPVSVATKSRRRDPCRNTELKGEAGASQLGQSFAFYTLPLNCLIQLRSDQVKNHCGSSITPSILELLSFAKPKTSSETIHLADRLLSIKISNGTSLGWLGCRQQRSKATQTCNPRT